MIVACARSDRIHAVRVLVNKRGGAQGHKAQREPEISGPDKSGHYERKQTRWT